MIRIRRNRKFIELGLISLLSMVFFWRVALFSTRQGFEQDSGWYLGVAKILAEKGLYASYLNLTANPLKGVWTNLRHRPSLQDENGYTHFPEGVTVGPGYIFPQALLIKWFGSTASPHLKFIYRLWPMVTFVALFSLLFFLLRHWGGMIAFSTFYLWIWFVPQLTFNFFFEAYSESIALLYLLLGFLFISLKPSRRFLGCFLAGLFVSFALLTKTVFLLFLPGVFLLFLWRFLKEKSPQQRMIQGKTALLFLAGLLLPILLFESYRFSSITLRFGEEAYAQANKSLFMVFKVAGSGPMTPGQSEKVFNLKFLYNKMILWQDMGFKYPFLFWGLFLSSLIFLIKFFRPLPPFLFLALSGVVIQLTWFVLLSSTGWFRHIWPAAILSLFLFAIALGKGIPQVVKRLKKGIVTRQRQALAAFLLLFLSIGFLLSFDAKKIFPSFHISDEMVHSWHKLRFSRKGLLGLPCCQIFPWEPQKKTIQFINEKLRPQDRLYYLDLYYGVELAPFVDRIFYPFKKYVFVDRFRKDLSGRAFLILSPFNRGIPPLSYVSPSYFYKAYEKYCERTFYQNRGYFICSLRK